MNSEANAPVLPRKTPGVVIAFHVVYTVLALQFLVPALIYAFAPGVAVAEYARLGPMLGGGAYPHTEDSTLWRVLAVANVLTLAFCCALIQVDLRKWFPVLTPLVFLKGTAAVGLLLAWFAEPFPGHLAGCVLDTVTVALLLYFGINARRALDRP
ncbi:MAG: hypothetical protein FJZ01_03755 [Candidatus Sericytochromatia bacterium]|nr:hypothetical protein [Candidatus Tanganyikabacteria bacterium]